MLFCGITIDHEVITDTKVCKVLADTKQALTVFNDAIHAFLEDVLADTETES